MAKIFYSMAGEGRGHAVRVRTLVEILRHKHELVLFASNDAYDFLLKSYGEAQKVPNVRLIRIKGITFHYTGGKLDLFKSIGHGLKYAWRDLPSVVNGLTQRIAWEQPDLCISDFEPALPRAASRSNVSLMSLDHQHVLLAYDLRSLPLLLRRYAWWMSWTLRAYYGFGNYKAVASSFYTPPLKDGFEQVCQIGPMLRDDLSQKTTRQGDYLLSYLRTNTPSHVLDTLAKSPFDVKVYGLGNRPAYGRLNFYPIDEQAFIDDLAGCKALVSAAGNQLLGEALYFGKPVLAIPEAMHHEQQINACFLKQMGAGEWTPIEGLTDAFLNQFLSRLDFYRSNTAGLIGRLNGTQDAINAITSVLKRTE
ncbi:MAG: teichoic acid biosynthesis protein, partial [Planctomycetes bacterium]|nr:teichoic acid biosynthesis protein [Planctomycetota bacterium]